MCREIAHVVVVNLVNVCEIFFDFFACADELASARAEISERNYNADADDHGNDDDKIRFEIDSGHFGREFRKPVECFFKKFHKHVSYIEYKLSI